MYYYPLQPPYFLLLVGFLTAFTSGLALSGTLKVIVQEWPQDKSAKEKTNTRSFYKRNGTCTATRTVQYWSITDPWQRYRNGNFKGSSVPFRYRSLPFRYRSIVPEYKYRRWLQEAVMLERFVWYCS